MPARAIRGQRWRGRTFLQAQTTECPVAALGMVLDHFGRHVSMEELRRVTGVSRDCVNASQLLEAARSYGLVGRGLRAEPEDLPLLGFPLIAHLRFIHFVVVEGMENGRVYLCDPAAGRHDRPLEEFNESFTGVVLKLEPGPDFRPGGAPARLGAALGRRLQPAAASLAAAAAAGGLLALPQVLVAVALEQVVDPGLGRGGAVLAAGMAAVLAGLLVLLRDLSLARLARRLTVGETGAILDRLLELPFAFFTYRLPIDLQSVVLAPRRLAGIVAGHLGRAFSSAFGIPLLLVAMAAYDATTALLVLLLAATLVVVLTILAPAGQRRLHRAQRRTARAYSALEFERIEMSLTGGQDDESFAGGASADARSISLRQEPATRVACAEVLPGLVEALALVTVLARGGLAVIDGRLGVGGVLALQFLASAVLRRARELGSDEGEREEVRRSIESMEEIAAIPGEPAAGPAPAEPGEIDPRLACRLEGPLVLRAVSFGYASHQPPLVDSVSMTVAPGRQVGIAGASGAGKSTLAALMAGLHRPWSGSVELGGRPLHTLPRTALRGAIAWIHRTPLLIEGTVRENLTLWDPSVDEADLDAAVRDACLDEVLAGRPGGLEAAVGSRGLGFSAGERQRLEIARALARRPQVLILDEAVDSLEPDLEARVRANLRRRGTAVVVVSHRETTLAACDQVVVVAPRQATAGGRRSPRGASEALAPSPLHDPPPVQVSTAPPYVSGETLARAFAPAATAAGGKPRAGEPGPIAPGHAGVTELARRWDLRARRIRFVLDDWWRRDSGPVLGALSALPRPVSLLSRAGAPYTAVDPGGGAPQELDEETARGFDRHAYALSPRLSDGAVRPGHLLRVAAAGAKRDLGWALVAGLAAGVLGLAGPVAGVVLARDVVSSGEPGALLLLLAGLVLTTLAAATLGAVRALALLRAEGRVQFAMAAALLDRLMRLPAWFFRQHPAADLARRAAGVNDWFEVVGGAWLRGWFAAATTAAPCLVLMAWLWPGAAALVAGAVVVPAVVSMMWLARRSLDLEGERIAEVTRNRTFLGDLLRGIARLRSADADRRALGRWQAQLRSEVDLEHRLRRREALLGAVAEASPLLVIAAVLWLLGLRPPAAGIGPGSVAGFQLALVSFLAATSALTACAVAALRASPFLERLRPILAETPEAAGDRRDPGRLEGRVEAADVSLRYPGAARMALDHVSFRAEPGELVAIVGPSGSGKSTLLRALIGFERPQGGTVCYDGHPLDTLDTARVRAQVGAVLQGDQLAVGTLRGNLAGTAPFDLAEVWEAARVAGLAEDIRRMPMGMQTILEDERFSTGEKQRLFIAARVLRRPRVLFLDEATSAVPEPVQREIFANLRALGITCVYVAHRASATALADRVYVLAAGRVVATGRPADLPGCGAPPPAGRAG